jgi:hypothetical protein
MKSSTRSAGRQRVDGSRDETREAADYAATRSARRWTSDTLDYGKLIDGTVAAKLAASAASARSQLPLLGAKAWIRPINVSNACSSPRIASSTSLV